MKIFSEYKNKFFDIVTDIINQAHNHNGITEDQIKKIVASRAFSEGFHSLENAILNKATRYDYMENLHLLYKKEGKYYPTIDIDIPILESLIEKIWFKMVVSDSRSKLFINDKLQSYLSKELEQFQSIFDGNMYSYKGIDDYFDQVDDPLFQSNFKVVIDALINSKVISYTNKTSSGGVYTNKKAYPIKLEYSIRNNKFRVLVYSINQKQLFKMNIASLSNVIIEDVCNEIELKSIHEEIKNRMIQNPITLYINNEKGSIERAFRILSHYRKEATYDKQLNRHFINLFYYDFDESEVIRDLFSLGGSISIVSPYEIRLKLKQRIEKQLKLVNNNNLTKKGM